MTEDLLLPPACERYLARMARELRPLPAPMREETMRELRTHVEDALRRGDSPEVVLSGLGEPAELAADWRDARWQELERAGQAGWVRTLVVGLVASFLASALGIGLLLQVPAWFHGGSQEIHLQLPGTLALALLAGLMGMGAAVWPFLGRRSTRQRLGSGLTYVAVLGGALAISASVSWGLVGTHVCFTNTLGEQYTVTQQARAAVATASRGAATNEQAHAKVQAAIQAAAQSEIQYCGEIVTGAAPPMITTIFVAFGYLGAIGRRRRLIGAIAVALWLAVTLASALAFAGVVASSLAGAVPGAAPLITYMYLALVFVLASLALLGSWAGRPA